MDKTQTLSIFTPTFNRAYCLGQCYQSLVNQDSKDFIWLIIDDGSTDGTESLVKSWIEEGRIKIKYHYQSNQGMHGAHNTAYRLIDTELNVCIDSDDFMPSDAVSKIIYYWNSVQEKNNIAGLVGLDSFKDGTIIGKKFPEGLKSATLEDIYFVHKVHGDKKLVYRTEIVKQFPPYPIFEGERFVPLGTLYLMIDKKHELVPINEVLCIVEYMEDGSSRNILKQYRRHPKGFNYARRLYMEQSKFYKVRFKNAIHNISHSIFLKEWNFIKLSPRPILSIYTLPLGIALHLYIRFKTKNI